MAEIHPDPQSDGTPTLYVWPQEVVVGEKAETRWHWRLLNHDGAQIAGSGSLLNGTRTKGEALDAARRASAEGTTLVAYPAP